jgi:hypothetical protein
MKKGPILSLSLCLSSQVMQGFTDWTSLRIVNKTQITVDAENSLLFCTYSWHLHINIICTCTSSVNTANVETPISCSKYLTVFCGNCSSLVSILPRHNPQPFSPPPLLATCFPKMVSFLRYFTDLYKKLMRH